MTAKNIADIMTGHAARWRIAAWLVAALILLLPAVATLFTGEVSWTLGDFIFAGVLLFGALSAYELAVRSTSNTAYRAGVGVAIAGAVLLTWINAAVGITDSSVDLAYLGVPLVGLLGAVLARFRAEGMAYALLATALAQAAVGPMALLAGMVPAHNAAVEILGLTGFFVVLFAGAAWLFWQSARGTPQQSQRPALTETISRSAFPPTPSILLRQGRMDNRTIHTLLSALVTLIGVALMIYMISAEGEPGAVPVLLIAVGTGWYFVARFRYRGPHA